MYYVTLRISDQFTYRVMLCNNIIKLLKSEIAVMKISCLYVTVLQNVFGFKMKNNKVCFVINIFYQNIYILYIYAL